MPTSPITSSSLASDPSAATNNALLAGLKLDDFLKMLLTELQNQDPLNPMESDKMLTQISQISQIGATQDLTGTLDSVLLGQNLSSATNLIGKTIKGLGNDGQDVTGKVEKVSVVNGEPVLHIGEKTVKLKHVREILPVDATS